MEVDLPIFPHTFRQSARAQPCKIDILPNDVLFDTFKLAALGYDSAACMPVVLSHVSSRWRQIALSCRLWSHIKIDETLGSEDAFRTTRRRVKHFLERSDTLDLDISIVLRTNHGGYSMYDKDHPFMMDTASFRDHTQRLSTLLGNNVTRIRRFKIVADEDYSVLDVVSLLPHKPMPMLELWSVAVVDPSIGYKTSMDEPTEIDDIRIPLRPKANPYEELVEMYPKLNTVRLCGIPMSLARFAPSNLQHLDLASMPHEQRPTTAILRDILLANRESLITLRLMATCSDDEVPRFVMPKLRRLTIEYLVADEFISFISSVDFPNLTELCILDRHRHLVYLDHDPDPQSEDLKYDETIFPLLTSLMESFSLEKIEKMALSFVRFTPPSWADLSELPSMEFVDTYKDRIAVVPLSFFAALSSLNSLTLVYPDATTLSCLNYLPVDAPADMAPKQYLPKLDHLIIEEFRLGDIDDFLKIRLENSASYRVLQHITWEKMPVKWWDQLEIVGVFNDVTVQFVELTEEEQDRLDDFDE